MDSAASPAPQAADDTPPTPSSQAGCGCLSLLVLGVAGFFGLFVIATDPASAAGVCLLLGAGGALMAVFAAAAGHKDAAFLPAIFGLALLVLGLVAVLNPSAM